ncbi:Uncharacterized protein TCM_040467 [Theobroma cacao]|uniref:Factor of DNA methylation 1-5/IDN2 domain-containing protein n=1 Tax=Theobroma cacao TaxID=3641 RepID=A0A061GTK3_THECC|nr:Uncharacterized protein TCM_040467 [Theobroma cacao]
MKTKMEAIEEELKKKEEEVDDLEELNQALIVKECVPFKIITDKEGNTKENLDEEDEKLSTLKIEFGDEIYTSVTTTFAQMKGDKNQW